MRASAHLAVARAGTGETAPTRITRLHSEPPLVLRPTNRVVPEPPGRWDVPGLAPARVSLVAGAAGPVGGDDLRLSVEVRPGAALVLRSIAATLVLPGPHGQPSRTEVQVRVAAGGVLVWLPGPAIAARDCRHQAVTVVTLEPGARLLLREELLLGRHGERPGAVRQRLRVCLGDRPLHDQEVAIGPEAAGWDGPAVTGGRRALGSLLVVDPAWDGERGAWPSPASGTDTTIFPLNGHAVLVTALADDALALRCRLDAGLAAIEAALPRACR
ncbi:MAG TPA: urease accessory protein UreD [Thermomicrobiales bacterium]|nr:urease accessory protein UreD [Thermomicrobiales bacterium]